MTTANLTKVIVPCRLSYAHLWEPDSINGSEPKYSVSCIIDKNDKETIAKIKKAIEVAKDEGKGKWGGKIPANLKTPLRDGDIDRPGVCGQYVLKCQQQTGSSDRGQTGTADP